MCSLTATIYTKIVFASNPAEELTTLPRPSSRMTRGHRSISYTCRRLQHLVLSVFGASPRHLTPASSFHPTRYFLDRSMEKCSPLIHVFMAAVLRSGSALILVNEVNLYAGGYYWDS